MIRVLVSEDKLGPNIGVREETLDLLAEELEDFVPDVPAQNENSEVELQCEAADNRLPLDLRVENRGQK